MGWLLHRLVVAIAAIVLVAGGVGRAASLANGKPACSDLHGTALAPSLHGAHDQHHPHKVDAHSHDGHHASGVHDGQHSASLDADCLKCCGICTAASSVPASHLIASAIFAHEVTYDLPQAVFISRRI